MNETQMPHIEKDPRRQANRSFETFRDIGSFEQSQLTTKEPYCFNGSVGIRRYRVTVEEIDDPPKVLEARLRKLWREEDNHHHWGPLQAAAAKLGIELKHEEWNSGSGA